MKTEQNFPQNYDWMNDIEITIWDTTGLLKQVNRPFVYWLLKTVKISTENIKILPSSDQYQILSPTTSILPCLDKLYYTHIDRSTESM